jgi:hypothetical protein
MHNIHEEKIIQECIAKLKSGKLAPWKVEEEIQKEYEIPSPNNFKIAGACRQKFIEEETGEKFVFISISPQPYKERYICENDHLAWELDISDTDLTCSLCGTELKPLGQYAPLVANYVGGVEDYYSYGGRLKVTGDLKTELTSLLVYGTGMGPMGVTRGCYIINKFGGAEVKVSQFGRAARSLGLIFKNEEMRRKAMSTIQLFLPDAKARMQEKMAEFGGIINSVEFEHAESFLGFHLYVDIAADFPNARGHGVTSLAVGYIKRKIEALLQKEQIDYQLSVIAQGYDGDLKPSPRNKRGRYASAQVRVPFQEFQDVLKVNPEKFLAFVETDRIGSQKLGCPFYSGMGGEIIPAIYRATKFNPRSCFVSSFQNVYTGEEKGDIIYRVELPNIEAGVISSSEGLIPPTGREALRIMGIKTAKEFAASVVSQVLAGEFNLALEISREKLYS